MLRFSTCHPRWLLIAVSTLHDRPEEFNRSDEDIARKPDLGGADRNQLKKNAQRWSRLHMNQVENVPIATVFMVFMLYLQINATFVKVTVSLFTFFRFAHFLCFKLGVQPFRTLCFILSCLFVVCMAFACAYKAQNPGKLCLDGEASFEGVCGLGDKV